MKVVIHHTAGSDTDGVDLDSIRRYHTRVKQWSDIGYHWVVETIMGRPYAIMARPMYREGSHTLGHNDRVGIAVVGNFMEEEPPDETLEVLADLCAALGATQINGHGELGQTSCPGDLFPMGRLRAMVGARA